MRDLLPNSSGSALETNGRLNQSFIDNFAALEAAAVRVSVAFHTAWLGYRDQEWSFTRTEEDGVLQGCHTPLSQVTDEILEFSKVIRRLHDPIESTPLLTAQQEAAAKADIGQASRQHETVRREIACRVRDMVQATKELDRIYRAIQKENAAFLADNVAEPVQRDFLEAMDAMREEIKTMQPWLKKHFSGMELDGFLNPDRRNSARSK